jgi:hypothetical protein
MSGECRMSKWRFFLFGSHSICHRWISTLETEAFKYKRGVADVSEQEHNADLLADVSDANNRIVDPGNGHAGWVDWQVASGG